MRSLTNQFTLLGFVGGDAWARVVPESKRQLRSLLAATAMTSSHPWMRKIGTYLNPYGSLESNTTAVEVGVCLPINEKTVRYTGPDQNYRVVVGGVPFRPSATSEVAAHGADGLPLFDEDGTQLLDGSAANGAAVGHPKVGETSGRYIVITYIQPLTLLSGSGHEYLAGVDYTFCVGGLSFNNNPFDLFPDGNAIAGITVTERSSAIEYAAKSCRLRNGATGVVSLLRDAFTPGNLLHAISDVCGFLWLDNDDTVIAVEDTIFGVVYELEGVGRVCVGYPHVRHRPGEFIKGNSVIGNPIILYSSKHGADNNWSSHISIGTVTGDSFLPPIPYEFEFRDYEVDLHTRDVSLDDELLLSGGGASDEFWGWLHRQQSTHDTYLANSLGFSTTSETRRVNVIRALLSYGGWGSWIIAKVVGWNDWPEARRAALISFLDLHMPAGVVFLQVPSDASDTYGVSVDGSAAPNLFVSDLGDNFVTDDGNTITFMP